MITISVEVCEIDENGSRVVSRITQALADGDQAGDVLREISTLAVEEIDGLGL